MLYQLGTASIFIVMDAKLKTLIDNTDFEQLFKKLGYSFFTNGDYNVNIIGVRNLLNGNKQDNTFNDALVMIYKVDGKWVKKIWSNTTDPGLSLLKKPSNSKGTAILVPGQYKGVYALDLHSGKYRALCQRLGKVKVYRDNNKNDILDFKPETIDTGSFGINIHKPGSVSTATYVNGFSAGCQVFKNLADFNSFMAIVEKSAKLYGNKFTYTLLTTDQMK